MNGTANTEELGLELSDEKTKITHIEDGFDFLGFRVFRCNKASNRRKVGVFVRPTDKGLKQVQARDQGDDQKEHHQR